MSIKSYLIHPANGLKDKLMMDLQKIKGCEVIPSENHELLVLITESDNKEEEEILFNQINTLENIKHINLVAGLNNEIL